MRPGKGGDFAQRPEPGPGPGRGHFFKSPKPGLGLTRNTGVNQRPRPARGSHQAFCFWGLIVSVGIILGAFVMGRKFT